MNIADIKLCNIYRPSLVLAISDIPDNFKWYTWFKENKFEGITYAFYYKNHVIKYGCSYAKFQTRKKSSSYGERLIRQVNNLPGRFGNPGDIHIDGYGFVPKSENGRDISDNIRELETKLGKKIDRDDIYLHIWDITNVHSTTNFYYPTDEGNKQRAEYFEALMVAQYKEDNNNSLPIGNRKQDPSTHNSAFTKTQISAQAGKLLVFA